MEWYKEPPQILHSEPRPAYYRQMIEDASRNIHLRRQAKTLLLFYANRSNSFRPSLKFIEQETGIPENKVSSVRKILDEHGLVAYHNYPGFIYIAWGNIRAYALL